MGARRTTRSARVQGDLGVFAFGCLPDLPGRGLTAARPRWTKVAHQRRGQRAAMDHGAGLAGAISQQQHGLLVGHPRLQALFSVVGGAERDGPQRGPEQQNQPQRAHP